MVSFVIFETANILFHELKLTNFRESVAHAYILVSTALGRDEFVAKDLAGS